VRLVAQTDRWPTSPQHQHPVVTVVVQFQNGSEQVNM
jgi:hypothetical protein